MAVHVDPRLALELGLKSLFLERRSPPRGRRTLCAVAEPISLPFFDSRSRPIADNGCAGLNSNFNLESASNGICLPAPPSKDSSTFYFDDFYHPAESSHLDGANIFGIGVSSDLYHSAGLPLYATSPHGEQNPTNTWTSSHPFDHSFGELIAPGTEGPSNEQPRISTLKNHNISNSCLLHQIQEEGDHSDQGVRCSTPFSQLTATHHLDRPFPPSSESKLFSTSQNVVALSHFSSSPENIHNISFNQVSNELPANATSIPQLLWGGFSVTASNTRQHLLPGGSTSHEICPTPRTPESFSSSEETPWTGLRPTSGGGDHSLEGSAPATAQSSSTHSDTSPNTIQCTWASCSKTFLTRSEYK